MRRLDGDFRPTADEVEADLRNIPQEEVEEIHANKEQWTKDAVKVYRSISTRASSRMFNIIIVLPIFFAVVSQIFLDDPLSLWNMVGFFFFLQLTVYLVYVVLRHLYRVFL